MFTTGFWPLTSLCRFKPIPLQQLRGAGICDKALMRRQNRVANGLKRKIEGIRKGSFHNEPFPIY